MSTAIDHGLGAPVSPMLARLVRELPAGDYLYEPKWDGFRVIAHRAGDSVELQSRHGRPLTRYFPELADAVRALNATRLVLDGEIVLIAHGRFDFARLMLRTHPAASRVDLLAEQGPATLIAFDLLAAGGEDLRARPFGERRERLEAIIGGGLDDRLLLTPITDDPRVAERWLHEYSGGGIDGVVAKDRSLTYQPGTRAMLKVKLERTVDCVVAGMRLAAPDLVASLLLGLYANGGSLHHVGVSSSFSRDARRSILEALAPLVTPLAEHPWERGFGLGRSPIGRLKGSAGRWDPIEMSLDWLPLRPEVVCEVSFDSLDDRRFRHPARFRRWRPDREPGSCRLDQLDGVPETRATEVFAADRAPRRP